MTLIGLTLLVTNDEPPVMKSRHTVHMHRKSIEFNLYLNAVVTLRHSTPTAFHRSESNEQPSPKYVGHSCFSHVATALTVFPPSVHVGQQRCSYVTAGYTVQPTDQPATKRRAWGKSGGVRKPWPWSHVA